MADDIPRRRVIEMVGTALTASLGGCASVLEAANGRGNSSNPDTNRSAEGTERAPDTETSEQTTPADSDDDSFDPEDVEIDRPSLSFASDPPMPDDPEQYEYATMGSDDTTATVYGNWKCPHTRTFVLAQLDDIVDKFVRPGNLSLEFRFLGYRSGEPFLGPDAPRAARAGLGAWNGDPVAYWSYLAHVFENQPQERYEWAQRDLLLRFAEAAGLDASRVGRAIDDDVYAAAVRANTDAASADGVSTVPRVVVDGDVTAPTVDPDATVAQLERATED